MEQQITDLRYPIGKFKPKNYSEEQRKEWLAEIKFLPNALEAAIHGLDEAQLHTPYRDGGWTVHQLVHHVADSHMNAFIRFKLGMTEENPTIKPYNEDLWVRHDDVKNLPVNISITLLFALHQRWHELLQSLSGSDFMRTVFHPEHKKQLTLWDLTGTYAWHGKHHTAHITALKDRMGW